MRTTQHTEGRLLDLVETAKAHIMAKIGHSFLMIKQLFKLQKVKLIEIVKKHFKVNVLAALTSLNLSRLYVLATGRL